MKHIIFKKKHMLLIFMAVSFSGIPVESNDFNRYFIEAAKAAKPSVVNIIIYKKSRSGSRDRLRKIANGSGTVILSEGYVVTNYHVVRKGNYFHVIYKNMKYELERFDRDKIYLSDPKTDLALLKLKNPREIYFKAIEFEDSNRLSEGEWVLAIGNPYGLSQSITSGIVSSKGRDNIGFADIENFIQTDVPINPGNSGGPLINLKGKLVGINTAIRSLSGGYQGISFAIPSNTVKKVALDLLKFGRVPRGWLGFLVREVSLSDGRAVQIHSVLKGSPAAMAGIKNGDIIRGIDGKRISRIKELIGAVGNKEVGSSIKILISRNNHRYNFILVLREKREYLNVQDGIDRIFNSYGIEIDENSETSDTIISYVSPGSAAYGLRKGDLVVLLNGRTIRSLDEFVRVFKRSGGKIHSLEIERDGKIIIIDF